MSRISAESEQIRLMDQGAEGASPVNFGLKRVEAFQVAGSAHAGTRAIHKLYERIAAEHGDRIAISYRGKELTYRELNRLADNAALHLRRLSVQPGEIVAVILPQSIELIVAFLAVLKCGAAYMPLDEANPPLRNAEFIRAANVSVLVCPEQIGPQYKEVRCVVLTSEYTVLPSAEPSFDSQPDDKAYVMYTSGSTGKPKAVVIPHRGIGRLVLNNNYVAIGPRDRVLQLAPPSFDASTFEIWGALLNGATLVPYSSSKIDINRLRVDMRDNHITVLWLTAALFSLVAEMAIDVLRSLRVLLVGGDVVNARYVNKVFDHVPGIVVINGYGPTENTTFTCCHVMTTRNRPGDVVPIGNPITGTHVHVLDDMCRPVPAGTVGELYVSGDGVALGYLDDMDSDAFFRDGAIANGLIYRTGDLVKVEHGTLLFIGRRDNLVKVRGHRVSLEEVRTHVVSAEGVIDAVIHKREMTSGDQILVAYVRRKEYMGIDSKSIRRHLAARIPNYMIPSLFFFDYELGIKANGKLDQVVD